MNLTAFSPVIVISLLLSVVGLTVNTVLLFEGARSHVYARLEGTLVLRLQGLSYVMRASLLEGVHLTLLIVAAIRLLIPTSVVNITWDAILIVQVLVVIVALVDYAFRERILTLLREGGMNG